MHLECPSPSKRQQFILIGIGIGQPETSMQAQDNQSYTLELLRDQHSIIHNKYCEVALEHALPVAVILT